MENEIINVRFSYEPFLIIKKIIIILSKSTQNTNDKMYYNFLRLK